MKAVKEIVRKYYKYKPTYDNPYTNPALSSNGTPYEDNFAVKDGGNNSNVYKGFNGVVDNAYDCTSYLLFYFKNPVNIKSLQYTGHSDKYARYRITTATLYGSTDNGETWEQVAYYETDTTVSGTCDFSENTQFFNTYKLVPTWNSISWAIYEAVISGNEMLLKATESTAQDYDFYEENFVYKALVEEKQIWHSDEMEYSEVGTYSVTLPEDDYEIEVYGGGGGAAGGGYNKLYHQSCGGGGAGFKGTVHLPNGTYVITVGNGGLGSISKGYGTSSNASIADSGGNSSFGELIIAGGGKYGQYSYNSDYPGAGGTLTLSEDLQIIETITSSNGNNGNSMNGYNSYSYGGLSLYDNTYTGYGAGGSGLTCANMTDGVQGYVKITKINGEGWSTPVYEYKAVKSYEKGQYYGD